MQTSYTSTAKWFHWIVFFLVCFELISAKLFDDMERGASKLALVNVHMSFGVIIIAVMILRLGWRLTHPAPPMPQGTPRYQRLTALVMHQLFYALLFFIPLTGWLWANAIGWQVTLFGTVALPSLVAKGWPLIRVVAFVHGALAWTIATLMVVHVLASLYHWYVVQDDILERMLPRDSYTQKILACADRYRPRQKTSSD